MTVELAALSHCVICLDRCDRHDPDRCQGETAEDEREAAAAGGGVFAGQERRHHGRRCAVYAHKV